MHSSLGKTQRAVVVVVLAAGLFTAVASHASPTLSQPQFTHSLRVGGEPADGGRWLDRLPRSVRRFIVTVHDMLVGPHP